MLKQTVHAVTIDLKLGWPNLLNIGADYDNFQQFESGRQTSIVGTD
jgi:hypothetical protein